MGMVICSFGLPIVLARTDTVSAKDHKPFQEILLKLSNFEQIKFGASVLTIIGNIVVYITIFGYFVFLEPDETNTYGGMA